MKHPDDEEFKQVKFYVTGNEGSVIISYMTCIELNVIHPHKDLDKISPDCHSWIYSKADKPRKNEKQNKESEKQKNGQVQVSSSSEKSNEKSHEEKCSNKEHSDTRCSSSNKELYSCQCEKTSNSHPWECPDTKKYVQDDQKSQIKKCFNIQPLKPEKT